MKERSSDIPYRNLLKRHKRKMILQKETDSDKGIIIFTLSDANKIKLGEL